MHKKQLVHGPQLHLKVRIQWKRFQKVSAEGLRSCSSSRGFSPQGTRRRLVPSEGKDHDCGRVGEGAGALKHPASTWV